jgi:hypothetical protein
MKRLASKTCASALILALLAATTGCSSLIGSRGVTSIDAIIRTGSTHGEVARALGDPQSVETRSDGTRVETRRIRKKLGILRWDALPAAAAAGGVGIVLAAGFLAAAEVVLTPMMLYASEKHKLHVAFVYGPDDRLLLLYNVDAKPSERFSAARRRLAERQLNRFEDEGCQTWAPCLTSYVDELRSLATFVGHTPSSEDEENFARLLDIGRDTDAGKIPKAAALKGINGSYYGRDRRELAEAMRRVVASCPGWVECVALYVDEYRQQGYAPDDEENFRDLLRIAKDVDAGTVAPKDGQDALGVVSHRLSSHVVTDWPRL